MERENINTSKIFKKVGNVKWYILYQRNSERELSKEDIRLHTIYLYIYIYIYIYIYRNCWYSVSWLCLKQSGCIEVTFIKSDDIAHQYRHVMQKQQQIISTRMTLSQLQQLHLLQIRLVFAQRSDKNEKCIVNNTKTSIDEIYSNNCHIILAKTTTTREIKSAATCNDIL